MITRLCLMRDLRGSQPVHGFDQLDLPGNGRVGVASANRLHIGAVHKPQLHVRSAKPHGNRSGFDQAHQRGKILARARRLGTKLVQFRFALAEIEEPDDRSAAGGNQRIRQMPTQGQAPAGTARRDDHVERRCGLLRAADELRQFGKLRLFHAIGAIIQLREIAGHAGKPEPTGKPGRSFDPSIRPDQQGNSGRFIDHPRKAPRRLAMRFRLPRLVHGRQGKPRRAEGPGYKQEGDQRQRDRGQFHRAFAMRARHGLQWQGYRYRQDVACRAPGNGGHRHPERVPPSDAAQYDQ